MMNLEGKTVLVTGGAGFIGSHIVDRLLDLGAAVRVLDSFDDFYNGKESNIKHNLARSSFSLIRGSILDEGELLASLKGVDVVIHMAGQAGIRYCNTFPEKAHLINVVGTFNLLQAMRKLGLKRLIYASSSSIFGPLVRERIDEDHPTNPSSPYGATKLAAEKYCMGFGQVYGLEVTSLRYFSVYGPRGRPDQIIAATYDRIQKGSPPIIYGDGKQVRDFTFISDAVDATVLAVQQEDSVSRIFNIGYGEAIEINDLMRRIMSRLNGGHNLQIQNEPSYLGDFLATFVDNSLARKILGWRPKVGIDQGLHNYFAWKTENGVN